VLAGLLAASLAPGAPTVHTSSVKGQTLISRSSDGKPGNGSSDNATFSLDQRSNRIIAFDSAADNLVGGDTNRKRDVFIVRRGGSWSQNAPPWKWGSIRRISKSTGGKQADGDSYGPQPNGGQNFPVSCVAFVSDASNLVSKDTNNVADAFVYDLSRGSVKRVSVSSSGRQANGPTYDVSVDGDCTKVSFTSTASNLALTSTSNSKLKRYVSKTPSGGHKQVYIHGLEGTLAGKTFLASRSNGGSAGNGDSYQGKLSTFTSKAAIAFTSTANNLASNDHNTRADVYKRLIYQASRETHKTSLVSATPSGRAPGNGASSAPDISGDGLCVSFETAASNLVPGENDDNGKLDVVRIGSNPHCYTGLAARMIVPKTLRMGNGDSTNPSALEGGGWVAYQSTSSNFNNEAPPRQSRDRDTVSDVFLFTNDAGNDHNVLMSTGRPGAFPATNPDISTFGNYVVYTSSPPQGPSQIYLAYVGPK
jgi:hypothetical protein